MREDATADVVSKMFEEPRRALDRGAGVLDAAGQQPVGRDHCGDVTGAGRPPGLRDDRVVSMPSRVHDPHVGVLPRWHGALGLPFQHEHDLVEGDVGTQQRVVQLAGRPRPVPPPAVRPAADHVGAVDDEDRGHFWRNLATSGGRLKSAGSSSAPSSSPSAGRPNGFGAGALAARAAAACSCWARLAGLPDMRFPLPFLPACLALARRPAPTPGTPGIPPPLARLCIIFRASKKRSTSWLTSDTWTPEPLAMRARREPSMSFGSARSPGVIDRMIAWTRSISRSSKLASWSRY